MPSFPEYIPDLSGKTIIITEGTSGVGAETVKQLALLRPSKIFFTSRDAEAANVLIKSTKLIHPQVQMHFIHCDLSDLNSVRQASNRIAAKVSRIDLFLCNANAMALSPGLSKDGYEQQFAINHLSQALLIDLLIPVLEDTAALPGSDVRIILSTSRCSASKFTPKRGIDFDALRTEQSMFAGRWRRYAQSKLANLLYAKTLNEEYPGITTVCIDPGVGKMGSQTSLTSLDRFFMSFKRSSVKQLALNGLWAATAPKRQVQGGAYYGPVGVKRRLLHHQANATLEEELWDWTQEELRKWEMRAGLKARDSLSSYQS